MIEALVDVKPPGPVQLYLNGPVPDVTWVLNVAEAPAQMFVVDGTIWQTGFGLTTKVALQVLVQPTASRTVAV